LTQANNNNILFLDYFKDLIDSLKLKKINLKETYFYLDNYSTHQSQEIINYISENNLNVIYGVNNCPLFDFCELVFKAIKADYHKKRFKKKKNFLILLKKK
jgi:hypothetical protein